MLGSICAAIIFLLNLSFSASSLSIFVNVSSPKATPTPSPLLAADAAVMAFAIFVNLSAILPKKSPKPVLNKSSANCLKAIFIFDVLVDKLSILAAIAPPNCLSKPFTRASVISFAPSAVAPNLAISSFDSPNSLFNIPNTSIPLSITILSSSRPRPPEADLCTVLINASKTPN